MVRAHCGVKAPSESRAVGALMEHPMETDSMETHITSMEVSLLEGFMESAFSPMEVDSTSMEVFFASME